MSTPTPTNSGVSGSPGTSSTRKPRTRVKRSTKTTPSVTPTGEHSGVTPTGGHSGYSGVSGNDSTSSQKPKPVVTPTSNHSGYSGGSGSGISSGTDNVGRQDAEKQRQPVNVPSTSGNSGATGSGISSGTSSSVTPTPTKPTSTPTGTSGMNVTSGSPATTSGHSGSPIKRGWWRRLFSWF